MLTIKKNNAPEMKQCEMLCDNGLHSKLNDYELTSYLNGHYCQLMIGRPKSGKTSLLYSLFESKKLLKKVYHTIYLFQPSASRSSMKDQLFNKLPEDQLFEQLNYEDLSSVLARIKSENPTDQSAIIFDDMTAYLKNKETLNMLREMMFNHRHLHLSIFFLVQTWVSVSKEIRKLFDNIFVFRVSKAEMESIFEEVVEQKIQLAPVISKLVYDKPYQYLFVNTNSGKLFKCFDEIIIP